MLVLIVGVAVAMLDPVKWGLCLLAALIAVKLSPRNATRGVWAAIFGACLLSIPFIVDTKPGIPDVVLLANLIAMAVWLTIALLLVWRWQIKLDRKRAAEPQFTPEELRSIDAAEKPWLKP